MDDLTKIDGIGPATAKKLKAAGIDSFAKLAAATPDALNQAKLAGGPDDWAGFIAEAAKLIPPPSPDQEGGGTPAAPPQAPEETEIPAGASSGPQASDQPQAVPGGDAGESPEGGAENPAPKPPVETRAGDPDLVTVVVKGPPNGRWRLGRHFPGQASEPFDVDAGQLAILQADPMLMVQVLE